MLVKKLRWPKSPIFHPVWLWPWDWWKAIMAQTQDWERLKAEYPEVMAYARWQSRLVGTYLVYVGILVVGGMLFIKVIL